MRITNTSQAPCFGPIVTSECCSGCRIRHSRSCTVTASPCIMGREVLNT